MAILPHCREQDYQAIDYTENADKLSLEEDRMSTDSSQSFHLPPPYLQQTPRQVSSQIEPEFAEIQFDWPKRVGDSLQDCIYPALCLLILTALVSGIIYMVGVATQPFRR